jgi:hypothetical protein
LSIVIATPTFKGAARYGGKVVAVAATAEEEASEGEDKEEATCWLLSTFPVALK